uniref:Uncharacterized protein n=1 Tax=Oryza meridionalis TaxID=40149 RepID=A0A0E0ENK2_9ORYZ
MVFSFQVLVSIPIPSPRPPACPDFSAGLALPAAGEGRPSSFNVGFVCRRAGSADADGFRTGQWREPAPASCERKPAVGSRNEPRRKLIEMLGEEAERIAHHWNDGSRNKRSKMTMETTGHPQNPETMGP